MKYLVILLILIMVIASIHYLIKNKNKCTSCPLKGHCETPDK